MVRIRSLVWSTLVLLLMAPVAAAGEPLIENDSRAIDPDRVSVAAAVKAVGPGLEAAFHHVRDGIRFEPYRGLLRGAHGTLLARSGNSLDQCVLLAAILEASGVESRFARGRLSPEQVRPLIENTLDLGLVESVESGLSEDAREVLAGLRDEITGHFDSIVGLLDEKDIDLTSPSPATAVLAAARDHWWLQAKRGEEWVDLDPSFPSAAVDKAFADPAELFGSVPDSAHHRVTIRVLLEEQGDAKHRALLTHESTAAALSGRSLVLTHQPKTWTEPGEGLGESMAGMIAGFGSASKDSKLCPVLAIGANFERGELFDLDAGKASRSGGLGFGGGGRNRGKTPIAEWVEVEFISPGGESETTSFSIFDRVGFGRRLVGDLTPGATPLGLSHPRRQTICLSFFTGTLDNPGVFATGGGAQPTTSAGGEDGEAVEVAVDLTNLLGDITHYVATVSDRLLMPFATEEGNVVFAATSPRLVIATHRIGAGNDAASLSIDLRRSRYAPVTTSKALNDKAFKLRVLKLGCRARFFPGLPSREVIWRDSFVRRSRTGHALSVPPPQAVRDARPARERESGLSENCVTRKKVCAAPCFFGPTGASGSPAWTPGARR